MNWHRTIGGPGRLALILGSIVLLLLLSQCLGAVVTVPFIVAFGWPWYLGRVVPQLQPDPGTITTAAVCLVGVLLGGHLLMRWLYAATAGDAGDRRWRWKWTVQTVGAVVLMFVAGIAATGLAHQATWLLTSPEPIVVTGDIRKAAARTRSANNMKQIVMAAHDHASRSEKGDQAFLPRTPFDSFGQPLHSWQTALLPHLEEKGLYQEIDQAKPWDHPDNAAAMAFAIRGFISSEIKPEPVNGRGVSHYAGNVEVWLSERPLSLDSAKGDFPKGLSNTILLGEVATNFRAWGDPLNVRDPRLGMNAHPAGFGAVQRNPLFAMADGSVCTFDPTELAELTGKVPE